MVLHFSLCYILCVRHLYYTFFSLFNHGKKISAALLTFLLLLDSSEDNGFYLLFVLIVATFALLDVFCYPGVELFKTITSQKWYTIAENLLLFTVFIMSVAQYINTGGRNLIYDGELFAWVPFHVALISIAWSLPWKKLMSGDEVLNITLPLICLMEGLLYTGLEQLVGPAWAIKSGRIWFAITICAYSLPFL